MAELWCEGCRELFSRIEDNQCKGRLQPKDLAGTARSGCYLCISLLGFLSNNDVNDLSDPEFEWGLEPVPGEDKRFTLDVRLSSPWPSYVHWCEFSFKVPPPPPKIGSTGSDLDLATYYQAPSNTSHPSLANLVQSWLRVCVDEHSGPVAHHDTSYRPPRLLHIDSGGLRLVEGSVCRKNSEWATLSHCWGPHPTFLTLTSTNMSQFELGIPLDSLPPTFMDAVKFCDSIGVKFLWIDSLCIIQRGDGSKEDWFHHMTEMRQVYQNATLNLAADWALSAEDGLFRERDTISIQRPVVQLHSGPIKGYWQVGSDSELMDLFTKSPLGSRAWVVQERFLSPRMVSFSADQVYWRCNHGFKSERFPDGYHPSVAPPAFCRSLDTEHENKSVFDMYDGLGVTKDYIFLQFLQEACAYSGRALTYPDSDKFAAFAGIAAQYSRLFKMDYIAGFFRKHLPWALAWQVKEPIPMHINRTVGTTSYRSPSWSWAAIDHEVEPSGAHSFWDHESDPAFDGPIDLLEVTDTRVKLADPENKFGPLLHASLKLRASLLECIWDIHTGNAGKTSLKLQIEANPSVRFDSVQDHQSDQKNVRLMPVNVTLDLDTNGNFSIHFLILSRVLKSNSSVYIRIGAGSIDDAESSVVDIFKSLPREEIELV